MFTVDEDGDLFVGSAALTQARTYNFRVKAANERGSEQKAFTLTVTEADPDVISNINIVRDTLTEGDIVDGAEAATFTAVGGEAPYTWALDDAGGKGEHNGLFDLDEETGILTVRDGSILEGAYEVQVKVTDTNEKTYTKEFTITVGGDDQGGGPNECGDDCNCDGAGDCGHDNCECISGGDPNDCDNDCGCDDNDCDMDGCACISGGGDPAVIPLGAPAAQGDGTWVIGPDGDRGGAVAGLTVKMMQDAKYLVLEFGAPFNSQNILLAWSAQVEGFYWKDNTFYSGYAEWKGNELWIELKKALLDYSDYANGDWDAGLNLIFSHGSFNPDDIVDSWFFDEVERCGEGCGDAVCPGNCGCGCGIHLSKINVGPPQFRESEWGDGHLFTPYVDHLYPGAPPFGVPEYLLKYGQWTSIHTIILKAPARPVGTLSLNWSNGNDGGSFSALSHANFGSVEEPLTPPEGFTWNEELKELHIVVGTVAPASFFADPANVWAALDIMLYSGDPEKPANNMSNPFVATITDAWFLIPW